MAKTPRRGEPINNESNMAEYWETDSYITFADRFPLPGGCKKVPGLPKTFVKSLRGNLFRYDSLMQVGTF